MFGLAVAKKPYLIITLRLTLKCFVYAATYTPYTLRQITHLMTDTNYYTVGIYIGIGISVKFSALYLVSKVSGKVVSVHLYLEMEDHAELMIAFILILIHMHIIIM